jgi:O-Antigen ligase
VDKFTKRALHICIFLLALSAPVSIAATQTAWAFAILFSLIHLVVVRPKVRFSSFDIAVLVFVGLSLISSLFSYEPRVSLAKMAAVSLVSIVYLVSEYVGDGAMVRRVVIILLASASVACLYAFATQAIGKNLKTIRLTADSPLRSAGVEDGYTILKANEMDVNSPDDLWRAISQRSVDGTASLMVYRHELVDNYKLSTADLHGVGDLGIIEWSRGHDTRASGFYGHYVTFAEALQLIASLALGLLIAAPGGLFTRNRILLAAALTVYVAALFLTVTRASWGAFAVSAAFMVIIGAGRKAVVICIAIAIPLAIAGGFYMQQKRQVRFVDPNDQSTSWRLMAWREGFDVLTSSPRHLVVGIGMDSVKTHWQDWHMFDDGRQPIGHLHDVYLQLAFERGVPALVAWIIWMAIYMRMLWRGFRRSDDAWQRGIFLGALGGTLGLLTSGLFEYNWGDSEVVMIFYLIMGLSLAIVGSINGRLVTA